MKKSSKRPKNETREDEIHRLTVEQSHDDRKTRIVPKTRQRLHLVRAQMFGAIVAPARKVQKPFLDGSLAWIVNSTNQEHPEIIDAWLCELEGQELQDACSLLEPCPRRARRVRRAEKEETSLRLQRFRAQLEDPELSAEENGYRTARVKQEIQRLETELHDLKLEFISRMAETHLDRGRATTDKQQMRRTPLTASRASDDRPRAS